MLIDYEKSITHDLESIKYVRAADAEDGQFELMYLVYYWFRENDLSYVRDYIKSKINELAKNYGLHVEIEQYTVACFKCIFR